MSIFVCRIFISVDKIVGKIDIWEPSKGVVIVVDPEFP